MHVGILRLGAMGVPLAAHLTRRRPLTVWKRTAVRAAAVGIARAEPGEAADYLDPIRLNLRQAGVEIHG
jgi:3-hydroxyisobutyrate dehydrogenase-like beta-hydroxyacid dehydrogenase